MNDLTFDQIRQQLLSTRQLKIYGQNELKFQGVSQADLKFKAVFWYGLLKQRRNLPEATKLLFLYEGPLKTITSKLKYNEGSLIPRYVSQTESLAFFESHFTDTYNTGQFNFGLESVLFIVKGETFTRRISANGIKRTVEYQYTRDNKLVDSGHMNSWDFFTKKE